MVVIPIFQDISSRFSIDIELNNEIFHLKFYWNAREEAWHMSIQDQNEVYIISDIKLVINYLLLYQYRATSGLPLGDFLLYDLEQRFDDSLNYDNLGKRYQLLFITNEELEGEISIGI